METITELTKAQQKRKFIVCAASHVKDLENSVNKMLDEGYVLSGSMSVTEDIVFTHEDCPGVKSNIFWQPMIAQ